jgi:hypothetical protein
MFLENGLGPKAKPVSGCRIGMADPALPVL